MCLTRFKRHRLISNTKNSTRIITSNNNKNKKKTWTKTILTLRNQFHNMYYHVLVIFNKFSRTNRTQICHLYIPIYNKFSSISNRISSLFNKSFNQVSSTKANLVCKTINNYRQLTKIFHLMHKVSEWTSYCNL